MRRFGELCRMTRRRWKRWRVRSRLVLDTVSAWNIGMSSRIVINILFEPMIGF
jgi:hypothetical protein